MATILFADDEAIILKELRFVADRLARRGHRTLVAADGREALAQLREAAPDILVTDLMMPHVDGWELIREMKRHYPDRKIGILLLEPMGATGEPAVYATDDIDGYLFKPCNRWQVVVSVKHLMYRLGLPDPPPS